MMPAHKRKGIAIPKIQFQGLAAGKFKKPRNAAMLPVVYIARGSVVKTGKRVERTNDIKAPASVRALKTLPVSLVPKLFSR